MVDKFIQALGDFVREFVTSLHDEQSFTSSEMLSGFLTVTRNLGVYIVEHSDPEAAADNRNSILLNVHKIMEQVAATKCKDEPPEVKH